VGQILRLIPVDVPPPGAGVTTVIVSVPLAPSMAEGSVALNSVELIKVVPRGVVSAYTTDWATNPEPLTVSSVSLAPASTPVGETE
jgi:hypothetical protein